MIVRTPAARSSTGRARGCIAAIGASLVALALGACSESVASRREAIGTRLVPSPQMAFGRHRIGTGESTPVGPALELLDTHETGVFNRGAAEVVDYHPATRRAFVVNSSAARVGVLELGPRGFRPGERTLHPGRDISKFSAGSVTSVAVGRDLVAVAVCARSNDARGRVAFYSAGDLRYLGAVTVGYGPDMLTFTPDGGRVLVANEGEQVRSQAGRIVTDPEGSVSIIDVSRGLGRASVAAARFDAFDARIEEYRNAGVRIPRLSDGFFEAGEGEVELSTDLEPEYIAVAPDGKTAWVSLQENDAVAVLDVAAARFIEILPLGAKDFSRGTPTLERVAWQSPAESGRPLEEERLGLWLSPDDSRGEEQIFYVLREGSIERVEVDGSRAHTARAIPLGSPNARAQAGGLERRGVRASERRRYRGLAREPQGRSFWVGDARYPRLYRFGADGRSLHALGLRRESSSVSGPASSSANGERRRELGVAALTLDARHHRLYVLLQGTSPAGSGRVARIVVIDAEEASADFGEALAEYLYVVDRSVDLDGELPGAAAEILGVALEASGQLLVLEGRGGGGRSATASVHRVDLGGASNLLEQGLAGGVFETDGADDLTLGYGLELARKRELFAIPSLSGRDSTRVFDLALLGDGRLALAVGAPEQPGEASHAFALVTFGDQNQLDASDRDGRVQLRHWPVLGDYMPDGIEALRAGGEDYFVTANEGDTREYDAKRLADVDLDPLRFPDAALLQARSTLGRLKISALDGDIDGDGDLDEIRARSISSNT